jgi:hypothetical protein
MPFSVSKVVGFAAKQNRHNSNYFKAAPMLLNFVTKAAVMYGIAVSKQTAIAAAIRPYSIAVAPDSSLMNFFMI